ncbi:MAG: alpha/beta fold hydrolase [Planctomycetota bacterium]|nr:alpha/beta fold hydrolase [Planctomycetota bacterium]
MASPVSALRRFVFALLFVFAIFPPAPSASEDQAPPPESVSVQPARLSCGGGLEDYDYTIQNGLYATITAFSGFEEPKIRDEDEVKVKGVPGIEKEVKVKVLWQERPAPLAVLLLGLATRSKSPLAQLWKQQMYDAGCHVLTFDSVFLPAFNERSRHGVPGNVHEEARLVAGLIGKFVESGKHKDRVTDVRILGASYGGILALNLPAMARKGELSFQPAKVLAVSPPVSMRTAAVRLDDFYRRYRWNYTLVKLGGDLLGHKPVGPGEAIPFTDEEMKAGIAAAFRLDLKEVIDYSDSRYKLGLLPKSGLHGDEYRRDTAGTWTFERYLYEMVYPYWQQQGKVESIDQMWSAGRVETLMAGAPNTVRVILAADDPLNEPAELERLRSEVPCCQLTVLPYGGHMGFVGTQWLKKQLLEFGKP